MTSNFDTDPSLAIKSLAGILCSKLKGIWDPPRMLEFEPDFPIRKLQLMHSDGSYENSINMQPLLFNQSGPSVPPRIYFKIDSLRFSDNGKTPYINIFDARVTSEDHTKPVIRAWPSTRAASCSKAWLHHHTCYYLILSHLVYGEFSLTKEDDLYF